MSVQGSTVSDDWVRSPLLNVKDACLSCHAKHDPKVAESALKLWAEQKGTSLACKL